VVDLDRKGLQVTETKRWTKGKKIRRGCAACYQIELLGGRLLFGRRRKGGEGVVGREGERRVEERSES